MQAFLRTFTTLLIILCYQPSFAESPKDDLESLLEKANKHYFDACMRYGGREDAPGKCKLPKPVVRWKNVLPKDKDECDRVGASWTTFRDTCADRCSFQKNPVCGEAITQACDCGVAKCWYQEQIENKLLGTCLANPKWEKAYDPSKIK